MKRPRPKKVRLNKLPANSFYYYGNFRYLVAYDHRESTSRSARYTVMIMTNEPIRIGHALDKSFAAELIAEYETEAEKHSFTSDVSESLYDAENALALMIRALITERRKKNGI